MRILSYQHKCVIDAIENDGFYFCNYASEFSRQSPLLYEELRMLLNKKLGLFSNPIFGWAKLTDINPLKVNEQFLKSSLSKVGFDCNDYYLLEMDIPDYIICLHDFYDFACFKADEEEGLCTREDLHQFVFNSKLSSDRDLQAIFPVIKKEWIVDIYSFKEEVKNGLYHEASYSYDSILKPGDNKNYLNRYIKDSSIFSSTEEPKELVNLKSIMDDYLKILENPNLDESVLRGISLCLSDYSKKVSELIYRKRIRDGECNDSPR